MTDLRQAAQRLVDRIDRDGASPLDWSEYNALLAALAQQADPKYIVQSNGRHSPLLTHMMTKRTTPAQAEPVAWTPVAEALPKSGEKVLACYRHRWGNLRPIRAFWTAAKTEEADSDDARMEYDEATDAYYVPEGWYECIDNWDDYSSVAVTEGKVTHWMPLPDPPKTEASHIGATK